MNVHVFDIFENRKDVEVPDNWWNKNEQFRIEYLTTIYGNVWAHCSSTDGTKYMFHPGIKNRPKVEIDTETTCPDPTESLLAENKRYREALERIADGHPYEPGETYVMQRIAREALGPNPNWVSTDDERKAVQTEIDAKDSL